MTKRHSTQKKCNTCDTAHKQSPLKRVYLSPKDAKIPENITVISAGANNQIASWEEDKSHSLFTKYYLKAMSGEADIAPYGNGNGVVDYRELEIYMQKTMTKMARRYYGRDQNMQIHKASTTPPIY